MSVWRRLQRVGKKAAKFEFTFSLQECTIECAKHYTPGNLVVVWSRRSRRHCSKPFKCDHSEAGVSLHSHVWEVPDNMVFTTTLYRTEKAIQFEEKEWTCQLEDIGGATTSSSSTGVALRGRLFATGASVRRRVLATRQIDLSEFAADLPTQQTLKISLRLATKHITVASVTVTVNSVVVKQGEATDEDMISVASMMSMSRMGSFNVGSGLTVNDVGAFSPPTLPRFASGRFGRLPNSLASATGSIGNFHSGIHEINTRLEQLSCSTEKPPAGDGTSGEVKAAGGSAARDCRPYAVSTSTMSLSNTGDSGASKLAKLNSARSMSTESSRDLLAWCQDVTKTYSGVHVTNLTTSFQSGLAFCAILHHFFPDKIQYPSQPGRTRALENCRLAFEVAAKLGVARVLDPAEITAQNRPPDLLSMMTYLHQLRTRCCSGPETVPQSDGDPQAGGLVSTTNPALPLQTAGTSGGGAVAGDGCQDFATESTTGAPATPGAPTAQRDGKPKDTQKQATHPPPLSMRYDHMLAKAQSMLQQTREKKTPDGAPFTDALPPLAHRPKKPRPQSSLIESPGNGTVDVSSTAGAAAADDDDGGDGEEVPPGNSQHASTRPGRSRRSLMRFNSDGTFCTSAEAPASQPRAGTPLSANHSPSHHADKSTSGDLRVRRLRLSQLNLFAKGRGSGAPVPIRIGEHHLADLSSRNRASRNEEDEGGGDLPGTGTRHDGETSFTPAHNSAAGLPAPSGRPHAESPYQATTADYISNEQAELDRTERELDEEASGVEQRLRLLMTRAPGSAAEEQLLRRWFVLVNKKSAITRRGMQLSIMEKEENLQKKMRMLQEELREMSKMEDYLKTDADKRREELLLRDLVQLVNKRDDLIQELDLHEQGLAEDLRLGLTAEQAISLGRYEKGCSLQ